MSQEPGHVSLFALFEEQVARTPEAVAVGDSSVRLTYRELHGRAEAWAGRLRAAGVPAGALVAVLAARSPEMTVALLAVLKVGAAYVGLDLETPPARLAELLVEAQPAAILTQAAWAGSLPPDVGVPVMCLDDLPPPTVAAAAATGDAEALAYVSFTSGTTGRPKGVCIPQRAVRRLVCGPDYVRITPGDVFLQFAPLAFDASTFEIWGALLNGARLAVCPVQKPSLPELAKFIEGEGVSILWLTAGLFHQFVDAGLLGHLRGVRQLLTGGDVLSVPHVDQARRALPDTIFINGYGPTENTTFTCCHQVSSTPPEGQSIPIGKPIHGTYCRVLDEDGRRVPVGAAGELYVGGQGLAHGYLRQPELTAEKFVPDPFSTDPAARLYRTGDRVREGPGGDLEFLGRVDRQVKIRGYRVELEEIEAVLHRLPGVRAAAVTLQRGTAGEERLVAGVVSVGGAGALTTAELRTRAQGALASYMVPGRFVLLDALPLNASGKVDRQALLDLVATAPTTQVGTSVQAGRDIGAAVAAVWREVLGLTEVEPEGNFFDCGGDSLRASHLLVRLQAVLGKSVPMEVFLDGPTVARLTTFIVNEASDAVDALQVMRSGGGKAPLFFVPSQGGDLMCYAAVARHFTSVERPLLGLQERTLLSADSEGTEQGTDIEEIAAAHVATLREHQPVGPYHLFGFCFGGLVAYEMARQLRASAAEVGWLGVLDYRFEPTGGTRGQLGHTLRAPGAFVRNLGYMLGDIATLPAEDWHALGRRVARTLRRRPTTTPPPARTGGVHLKGVSTDLSHYTPRQLRLLELHELAWQRYRPPLGTTMAMTMFRPRRLPLWRAWDASLGWGAVAGSGLRVRVARGPGTHGALLREPFARELAREIELSLRDAT